MTEASASDARLAEGLRRAHQRVAALEADEGARARALQRLLAINDAAKRDTTRAAARLERFLSELDRDSEVGGSGAAVEP